MDSIKISCEYDAKDYAELELSSSKTLVTLRIHIYPTEEDEEPVVLNASKVADLIHWLRAAAAEMEAHRTRPEAKAKWREVVGIEDGGPKT